MQHIETQASDSLPEDIPVESILRCKRLVLAAMLQQITRTPLHCFLPPTHHTRAPTTTPIRRLEEAAKTLPYKIKEQEERQCKPGFQCSTSGSCDALQEANKNKHTTARTTQTTHCSTQSRAHIHTHTHTLVPSCLRARQGVLRYSSSMGGNDGAASGSSSGSTAWDRGWPMPLEIMDRQPKTKKRKNGSSRVSLLGKGGSGARKVRCPYARQRLKCERWERGLEDGGDGEMGINDTFTRTRPLFARVETTTTMKMTKTTTAKNAWRTNMTRSRRKMYAATPFLPSFPSFPSFLPSLPSLPSFLFIPCC